jgi:hypothetical protein
MPMPSEIRDGLGQVCNAIDGLQVYDRLTESVNMGPGGCVVVGPFGGAPISMGRGTFQYAIPLYVIVPLADYSEATRALDELVAPDGTRSVWAAIWGNRSLGLADTDAHVEGLTNYGGTLADAQGVDHLAAQLDLVVLSKGTA